MLLDTHPLSVVTRALLPWAAVLALGCGTAPETVQPEFDPGRCRAEAAQMTLDSPIQGRLDVPAGAQGGCWRLGVPPGTLSVVINLDQAQKTEGARLRLTDRIGQPIEKTPIGILGSATTLTHRFEEAGTVIVELTATAGASSFGMEATHEPPPPPDPDEAKEPESKEPEAGSRGGRGGRNNGPASKPPPPPPPPPPPIVATYTRVRPIGRTAVEYTVVFTNGDEAWVDWSGPVTLMDGGAAVGTAVIESHKRNHAVLKVKGLTQSRVKQCVAHFTRKAP